VLRRNWLRILGVIGAVVLLTTAGWRPAQQLCAGAIVRAPNHGRLVPAPEAGELRIPVGPPEAALSVEIMDGQDPAATVFVLHGIRDDKRSMRGWGKLLADHGFRAILVDLRGHGRSSGEWLSYGVVESHDLVQVLDAIENRGLRVGSIGAMGISYGAATAIEWAGLDPRVRAVVAIAPFASLRDVVPGYSPIPLPASFIRGAIDEAGEEAGFDPDAASPVLAIGRTSAETLILHGTSDARIPLWHSLRIAAAGAGHTELVKVEGAGHGSIARDPDGSIGQRAPLWFSRWLLL
jgi:pimeloyl-ACP methyl ester carboxylesterase